MNILVPTDFSRYSDYALNAAILIAEKMNAELFLYHNTEMPDAQEETPKETQYKDEYLESRALRVKGKLKKLKETIEAKGLNCTTFYHGGNFFKNLEQLVDYYDFDLIVMGSHGVSGKEEWFIGSNTQKVIRKLRKKVLVVKNEVSNIDFKKAVFVTGLNTGDKEALKEYLDFLSIFNTEELHILSIDTFSFFPEPSAVMLSALEDFKDVTTEYNIKTHFYKDFTIDSGVRHFSAEHNIDIIGISNKVRSPIKRFFKGSNVEITVNHSELPILSIDF